MGGLGAEKCTIFGVPRRLQGCVSFWKGWVRRSLHLGECCVDVLRSCVRLGWSCWTALTASRLSREGLGLGFFLREGEPQGGDHRPGSGLPVACQGSGISALTFYLPPGGWAS